DTRDLEAPRMGRLVDHRQQARVDLVTLGQRFVEHQRTEHGADIGHDQVDDRDLELGDLVGRLGRVENLVEHHAVDLDHRVVLGDDVLRRNVHDLFHHVDLVPDVLHDRHEQMETRRQRVGVLAPAFHGPFIALRNDADQLEQDDDGDDGDDDGEYGGHYEVPRAAPREGAVRCASISAKPELLPSPAGRSTLRAFRTGIGMSNPHALIVDDERDIRELLTLTLGRMGLVVETAADIAESRARLASREYALCLTDMRLPDGSGQEIVELIAAQHPDT